MAWVCLQVEVRVTGKFFVLSGVYLGEKLINLCNSLLKWVIFFPFHSQTELLSYNNTAGV